MILKKIKIMNYRQLESVELDMQESLTVLVGPNNSGKTTLISVLKGMFCDKKLGFSYSDIPISLSSMWLEKTVPVFQEIMLEYDKEKGVQKIIDEMTDNDKLSKDYTIDNFRAQIQVDYDPDSDNIQYFADYLMDLDDTKGRRKNDDIRNAARIWRVQRRMGIPGRQDRSRGDTAGSVEA